MFGNLLLKTLVSAYGPYLSLGLICFIVLCILTIFLVSIATKTPFGFGLGFFKINFGNKDAINKDGLVTNLLEYQEEHIKNIIKIETSTLKRQMNYAEQKLSQFKYLLTNSYSTILSSKLKDNEDVKLHKDYRSYQILIGMLVKDLLDKIFYEAFVENHLEEFDDAGWKDYLDDKSKYIFNYNTDFLDNLYGDGRLVSRKESYEEEKKLLEENKEVIYSIFDNAKEVAKQSKIDLQKEKEFSQLTIKQICKNSGIKLEE